MTKLFINKTLARETSAYDWRSRVESRIEPMSEAVNGGKNENKSESKRGALQKFLPGGEAAD